MAVANASEMAAASGMAAAMAARLGRPVATRERCLPVGEAFAGLLPDAGLVRGRSVACSGPAAWSLAIALVAEAARAGSWVAAVGTPELGIEAADGLGVPLGRLVVIDVDGGPAVWAERVAAAADGFEIILTTPPIGAERVARRVRQRVQSNAVVLVAVAVDRAGSSLACDVDLASSEVRWHGIGHGYGHLMARRVVVAVGGRRSPRARHAEIWLPGHDGTVTLAAAPPIVPASVPDEPVLEQAG
jgi:hypothetical protein